MPEQLPTQNQFEAKLHTLVYPQIAEKAPKLVKNMVAFELIEVNDDESDASAVYVFRIGEHLIFVPVFYHNGDIDGMDLMYLDGDDLFLPLQESWIDYIYGRQPHEVGRLLKKHEQVGGDTRNPLFDTLEATFAKAGSYSPFMKRFLPALRDVFTPEHIKELNTRTDILGVLPKLEKSATESLLRTISGNDEFGRAFFQFYPFNKLAEVASEIDLGRAPSNDPIGDMGIASKSKPVVLTSDNVELSGLALSKKDQDELKRTGAVIRDNRNPLDATQIFRVTVPKAWFNPDQPGSYNIVERNGDTKKALVFTDIVTVGDGKANGLVAVDEDKVGGYFNRSFKLLATDLLDIKNDFNKWFKAGTEITSAELKSGDTFLIVNEKMQTTLPLTFVGRTKGDDNSVTIWVSHEGDCGAVCCCPSYGYGDSDGPMARLGLGEGIVARVKPVEMTYPDERSPFMNDWIEKDIAKGNRDKSEPIREWDYKSGRRVVVLPSADHGNMTNTGNILYAGKECRVVKIDNNPNELKALDSTSMWMMAKNAGIKKLTIRHDRDEFEISCGVVKSGRVTGLQALRHLITVHGVTKDDAFSMMKAATTASVKRPVEPIAYGVKYAMAYPDITPVVGTNELPSTQMYNTPANTDTGKGNEPFLTKDIQTAVQAAQSGQKSVFDTAVLTSLIRRHDIVGGVEEMLGDITMGLDRIGRLLFLIYAHRDDFEEEYGKEEIPLLEDSLKNTFDEMGETLLFLKNKSSKQVGDSGSLGLVTT